MKRRKRKVNYDRCLLTRPRHIAIVAMGDSSVYYMRKRTINRDISIVPDEVWGINFVCDWLKADKIFLMDGFAGLQDIGWKDWVKRQKKSTVPFIVPFKEPGFENTVEYPLGAVVGKLKEWRELSNTPCYALAYAAYLESVKRVDLFGFDFDYATDKFVDAEGIPYICVSEDTKAATAFWCGFLLARGVAINVAPSRFLNTNNGEFYGYPKDRQPRVTVRPASVEQTKTHEKDYGLGALVSVGGSGPPSTAPLIKEDVVRGALDKLERNTMIKRSLGRAAIKATERGVKKLSKEISMAKKPVKSKKPVVKGKKKGK